MLSHVIYPSSFKDNILTILHKSKELNDPNNFRGIGVSSCLGKLFDKMLQIRLEEKCQKEEIISNIQGSGKTGSRTCDHLLIVRFLIDKYVNQSGGRLYACFVDLKKCYDSVPRIKLFYTLLKKYKIGGNFFKIIMETYRNNKVFIKLSEELCQNAGVNIKQHIKSRFEVYWLNKVNLNKIGDDGLDHNKLRLYKQLKGNFSMEPYLTLVKNRNQRFDLTKMRLSAHNLTIERLRYVRPSIPASKRVCKYCNHYAGEERVDDEFHAIIECQLSRVSRQTLFSEITNINPRFPALNEQEKLRTLLCPTSVLSTKLINR